MKSIRKGLAGWWPFQAIVILCGPVYLPTLEESEKYWDAKMLAEYGIDACTLYGPEDLWWWQQLEELQEQAAARKRFDKYLNKLCAWWAVATLLCFAAALYANWMLK